MNKVKFTILVSFACASCSKDPFALKCEGIETIKPTERLNLGETRSKYSSTYIIDEVKQKLSYVGKIGGTGATSFASWCSAGANCKVEIDEKRISGVQKSEDGNSRKILINRIDGSLQSEGITQIGKILDGFQIESSTEMKCAKVELPIESKKMQF